MYIKNHLLIFWKLLIAALDLASQSNVQDAFVIAVEQQGKLM